MIAKSVALLLADLGVTKTHGRPHVSNDNPYSESQFKTLKYSPEFPERFGSLQDARSFLLDFFQWYNTMHHHSGLGLLTPFDVHYGLAESRLTEREATLRKAFAATPERFVRGMPRPPALPQAVWINKPRPADDAAPTALPSAHALTPQPGERVARPKVWRSAPAGRGTAVVLSHASMSANRRKSCTQNSDRGCLILVDTFRFVHPSVSGIVRATGVPEYEPPRGSLAEAPVRRGLDGWPSATIRSSSPKSIRTRPPATPLGPPDISPTPPTASSLPACLQSRSDALLTARTL